MGLTWAPKRALGSAAEVCGGCDIASTVHAAASHREVAGEPGLCRTWKGKQKLGQWCAQSLLLTCCSAGHPAQESGGTGGATRLNNNTPEQEAGDLCLPCNSGPLEHPNGHFGGEAQNPELSQTITELLLCWKPGSSSHFQPHGLYLALCPKICFQSKPPSGFLSPLL